MSGKPRLWGWRRPRSDPMSEEKPLHVRVAEALGCKVRDRGDGLMLCECDGQTHGQDEPDEHGDRWPLRHYDTDWSVTGPLIEKYGVLLYRGDYGWNAYAGEVRECLEELYLPGDDFATGPAPLVAACNLILALHAAGKL